MEVGYAYHLWVGHPTDMDPGLDFNEVTAGGIIRSSPQTQLWYSHGRMFDANYALFPDERKNCLLWTEIFDGRCPWSSTVLENADVLAVRFGRVRGGRGALLVVASDLVDEWAGRPISNDNMVITDTLALALLAQVHFGNKHMANVSMQI